MERLTMEYCGEYVPKELCSIDRFGDADDCDLCCEYCKATEEGNEDCTGCAINRCFNKLGEYEDLEEQGKLLKLSEAVKIKKDIIEEEDILKFYYCESEDEYYIGKRIDTMYYAKYSKTGFVWFMSRNLPWGEHVVDPKALWKEHTYPSEPKEIPFFEWLQGFMKKECMGRCLKMQYFMTLKVARRMLELVKSRIMAAVHKTRKVIR